MIKLIATDVDGTLFPDYGQNLTADFFETLKALMTYGVMFGPSSGRPLSNLKKVFSPVADDIFYMCQNGASSFYQNKNLFKVPMANEDIQGIIQDVRTLDGCACVADTGEMCYLERGNEEGFAFMQNVYHFDCKMVDDLLKLDEPCIKFTVYRETDVEEITNQEFTPKWRRKLTVACSGDRVVDLMSKRVSKRTALARIQKKFGVSPEETLVFGDNINDLEMLNQAKYSVAVGNARNEVKEACHYITDNCDHDGELKVLNALLADFDHPDAALAPFRKNMIEKCN